MSKLKFNIFDSSYALFLELIKKINIFTYIVGSKAAFFSLSQALGPMTGILGTSSISTVFIIRTLYTVAFSNLGLYMSLLYHIPTLCAAIYLNPKSKNFRFVIPLLCMILFITHPIGSQAYLYSFYWIIPTVIAFINPNSMFFRALGSTFTAHAVGSIMYLYSASLAPNIWLSLIPIVWAERLIFASTMTAFYYAASAIGKFISNQSTNINEPIAANNHSLANAKMI